MKMTHRPHPLTIVAFVVVAGSPACSSATRERAGSPNTPKGDSAAAAAAGRMAFRYRPGTYHYTIRSAATVELDADSASSREPITTTAYYTLAIAPAPGERLVVTGTVDSASIAHSGQIPGASSKGDSLSRHFRATMSQTGQILAFEESPTSSCGSGIDPFVALAREIFLPLPPTISVGAGWQDTSTTTTCRGQITATVRAIQRYRVDSLVTYHGMPALKLLRASTLAMSGSGGPDELSRRLVSLAGQGASAATIYLQPQEGTVLGVTSDGESTLTVTTPRGATPFHQRVHQEIVLEQ